MNTIDIDVSRTTEAPSSQYAVQPHAGVRKRNSHLLLNHLYFNVTARVNRPGGCLRVPLQYDILLRPGYHTRIEHNSNVILYYGTKHKSFQMVEPMAAKYVRVYYD